MSRQNSSLENQLQRVTNSVTICETARQELLAARARLAEIVEHKDERLQQITEQHQRQLSESLRRLHDDISARRETLDLDIRNQTASFRSQHEDTLHQLQTRTAESLARLTDREDNEVWVLQSVFDDEAADSPREKLDRENEAFRAQQEFFNQRNETLRRQLELTREYLAASHVSVDSDLPEPRVTEAARRDLAEVARHAGDGLLSKASEIDRLLLPHWIRGPRIWLLGLLIMLVVFFPVFLSNADLSAFLNPDMATPNWQWLGVSAVIAMAMSLFAVVILVVRVQHKTRSRFAAMLQEAANARHATTLWEQKSEVHHAKMERVAEKWLADLTSRRDERVSQLRARFSAERSLLESHVADVLAKVDADCQAQEERVRLSVATERQRLDEQEQQEERRLRREAEVRIEKERSDFRTRVDSKSNPPSRLPANSSNAGIRRFDHSEHSLRNLLPRQLEFANGRR